MTKREFPVQAFQDLLNAYVDNGWFPRKLKIVKDANANKRVVVTADAKLTFQAYDVDDMSLIHSHNYSVADLFSVESVLHEYVNRKTRGYSRQRDGQSPIKDIGYGYQYMNMATMTTCQKMEYFLEAVDMT